MAQPEVIPQPDDFESSHQGADYSQTSENSEFRLAPRGMQLEHLPLDTAPMEHLPAHTPPKGRTPVNTPSVEPAPTPWTGAASSVPRLTVAPSRELKVRSRVLPGDDSLTVEAEPTADFPEADADDPPAELELSPPKPHDEPLWFIWAEALATNRPLQIGIAAALIVVLALTFWPRHQEPGVSLGDIRRHPERFESRAVRVRGEVGDVFAVGRGHVYHLVQGGDSVVVFTSGAAPRLRDRVAVTGTVSTGYLDGSPRIAIFETPPSDH